MADSLVPWSNNAGNPVTDVQHRDLWSDAADGLLPQYGAGALKVSVSPAGAWSTASGTCRLSGRVFQVDAKSGPLPAPSAQARVDVVCAYIDFSKAPWTFGVHVHQGTPGGDTPAVTRTLTSLWEVPLASVQTLPTGAVALLADLRQFLLPQQCYAGPVSSAADGQQVWNGVTNVLTVGTGSTARVVSEDTDWQPCGSGPDGSFYWSPSYPSEVRRHNGQVFLRANQTRVGTTYPVGSPGGSLLDITIPSGFRPVGNRLVSKCVWCDSGAGWLVIASDGSVRLRAIAADMAAGYSVHIDVDWTI